MRPFKFVVTFSVIFMLALLLATPSFSAEKSAGKVYKIGYIEGGEFWVFTEIKNLIQKYMNEPGHINAPEWNGKVEYPADAQFSPGWDDENLKKLPEMAQRLMARDDLDLIIAAGTDATRAVLKANNNKTPIISIAVSDPIKSGFVKDENDSGIDNYTARLEPGRYKRMFRIFHDVVMFQKLGLMYPDNDSGRLYTNLDEAYQVSKERGFQVIEYNKVSSVESNEECYEGIKYLIDKGIDAFFIPVLNCFDWKKSDVKRLLDLLTENKIPTFAREGTKYVKSGALMGFSSIDFSQRTRFIVRKIIRIFNGEKPRSLPMVDDAVPKISINLHVAEQIGFDPSFDILSATDEIFQENILPDDRLVK